jgi:hypothetical protein
LPSPNLTETFSNSGLEPNCMVILFAINMNNFQKVLPRLNADK